MIFNGRNGDMSAAGFWILLKCSIQYLKNFFQKNEQMAFSKAAVTLFEKSSTGTIIDKKTYE